MYARFRTFADAGETKAGNSVSEPQLMQKNDSLRRSNDGKAPAGCRRRKTIIKPALNYEQQSAVLSHQKFGSQSICRSGLITMPMMVGGCSRLATLPPSGATSPAPCYTPDGQSRQRWLPPISAKACAVCRASSRITIPSSAATRLRARRLPV